MPKKEGDALDKIIDQIKKIQEKIDALEAKGLDASALEEKIANLEASVNRNPNFGSWD